MTEVALRSVKMFHGLCPAHALLHVVADRLVEALFVGA